MSKLNQEELLSWFDNYIDTRAIPLDHLKKFEQIAALIQKPGVTEEWIEEKAMELYGFQPKRSLPGVGIKQSLYLSDCRDFIRSLVEDVHVS